MAGCFGRRTIGYQLHNEPCYEIPLELLIGKVARPLTLMTSNDDDETGIDLMEAREHAADGIEKSAAYEKARFDKNKAKVVNFRVGDLVLIKNEERNQTKLEPKFKGPFKIVELLENDRYVLKSLTGNRTYKYAHDRIRKMPQSRVPPELDPISESDEETNESSFV